MRTINVYQNINDLSSVNIEVTAETIETAFLIGLQQLREEFHFSNEDLLEAGWTICPHCNIMSDQETKEIYRLYPGRIHHIIN